MFRPILLTAPSGTHNQYMVVQSQGYAAELFAKYLSSVLQEAVGEDLYT
jgi:hypothetical protein